MPEPQSVAAFVAALIKQEFFLRYVKMPTEERHADGSVTISLSVQGMDLSILDVEATVASEVRMVQVETRHFSSVHPFVLEGVRLQWRREHPDDREGVKSWEGSPEARIVLSQLPSFAVKKG